MAIPPIQSTPPPITPNASTRAGVQPLVAGSSTELPSGGTSLSNEQIEKTVEQIRQHIAPVDQNLLFSIDKDTGKTIVKLIDASTKEVLRQIPSEELIAIAHALGKGQSGLIERKA